MKDTVYNVEYGLFHHLGTYVFAWRATPILMVLLHAVWPFVRPTTTTYQKIGIMPFCVIRHLLTSPSSRISILAKRQRL